MIYPDLNLVMNSIRILNNKEIALNFRLIYFMAYTVQFPWINTFVTWRWPRAGAETCRQFKITTSDKFSCVLTHQKPFPYCIIKHNTDDASKDSVTTLWSFSSSVFLVHYYLIWVTANKDMRTPRLLGTEEADVTVLQGVGRASHLVALGSSAAPM